ncbi:16S rRNA G966 N2-methylase RsmD [Flavobacterium sp. 28A]|uniref:class I SAM-dependent methyltransferase n=1 Tax=Flavobacterium sp. 28A TaxID=2735895 RepID=UPI001570716C|nr:class I SAM-dependent methyltransferase [Flavobacterium sp. 28A]NRT15967.1 16S rRNA G966 N2-methylase RsmD [Flavobacterium sp. 28A]
MDLKLLNKDIQEFICKNLSTSISKLALQKNPFPAVEWITILKQIEAKAKAKEKLPSWFSTEEILYPTKISIEQTSSEKTALYKSTIVSGESLIDLTGGFGVDDFFFSKKIRAVTHCEINEDLSTIVQHNFKKLEANNITCYTGDSTEILISLGAKWDWIYIDPSRRNEVKGKVFMLKDCLPNVPENLNSYFENSDAILIKTAPLLDLSAGLSELKNVKKIHIVALENEVKELLWELHKNYSGSVTIHTANILKNKIDEFKFVINEQNSLPDYSLPQEYLYEPNSAIMKSGGFDEVGIFYKINKLHKHSHLYTSKNLIESFPGRIFKIQNMFNYNKVEMNSFMKNNKSNITIRNFPETVENIRKKWKIKEGGVDYSFFTTDEDNNKIVLICNKI